MADKTKVNFKLNFSRTGGIGLPIAKTPMTLTEGAAKGKYIPCSGDGIAIKTDNKYLETLAKIASDSPTHGAAIVWKKLLTFGQGFDLENLPKELQEFCANCNEKGDTINDILERVCWDWALYESLTLAPSWTGGKKIAELRHVPFKNTRIGMLESGQIPYYIVNNDWHRLLDSKLRFAEILKPFNPEKINEPTLDGNGKPIFDETTKENAEQLIYFTTYSPASDGFYPVPSYAGGLDAALTEVDTIITMKNGISNGINGAYIVSAAEGTVLDDTAKQKVTNELNEQASGAENSGTIIFLSLPVKVEKMDPIDHEIYTVIDDKAVNKIVTAHNIPAILLEVTNSGGFNNRAAEMDAAINQFQKTTILAYQQKITKVFKKILSFVTNQDFDLKIIPFSLLDAVAQNEGGDTNINS